MTAATVEQSFIALKVPPHEMDRLWAEGWRHFGIFFFQYRIIHGRKEYSVMPLRVNIGEFALTRSQKRVLKKNRDARIVTRRSFIDEEKAILFAKHRLRFKENIPSSLYDFLSPAPASLPCHSVELCVYLGHRLAGVTFLDVGDTATSAVYAIFDPAEANRGLGIFMMLSSVRFSRERGCHYYYPGYAYREPSPYDYKKRLAGLEYLEWGEGWRPYTPGQDLHCAESAEKKDSRLPERSKRGGREKIFRSQR